MKEVKAFVVTCDGGPLWDSLSYRNERAWDFILDRFNRFGGAPNFVLSPKRTATLETLRRPFNYPQSQVFAFRLSEYHGTFEDA